MKILITGSKGSGKTTLARPLSELLGAIYVDDDYMIVLKTFLIYTIVCLSFPLVLFLLVEL
jgi:shikimate kinase